MSITHKNKYKKKSNKNTEIDIYNFENIEIIGRKDYPNLYSPVFCIDKGYIKGNKFKKLVFNI